MPTIIITLKMKTAAVRGVTITFATEGDKFVTQCISGNDGICRLQIPEGVAEGYLSIGSNNGRYYAINAETQSLVIEFDEYGHTDIPHDDTSYPTMIPYTDDLLTRRPTTAPQRVSVTQTAIPTPTTTPNTPTATPLPTYTATIATTPAPSPNSENRQQRHNVLFGFLLCVIVISCVVYGWKRHRTRKQQREANL